MSPCRSVNDFMSCLIRRDVGKKNKSGQISGERTNPKQKNASSSATGQQAGAEWERLTENGKYG